MTHTSERTCLELAKEENQSLYSLAQVWENMSDSWQDIANDYREELHSRRLHVFYTIIVVGLISFIGGIFFTWVRLNMMCDKWYAATLGSPIKETRCTYNVWENK